MKRKLLTVLGLVLTLTILVGIAVPAVSAADVTVEALNPLAHFEIQDNQPLTDRSRFINEDGEVDFTGKYIGIANYGKVGNLQAIQALGDLLQEEFPGVTIVGAPACPALGSPWHNKTDANYNIWAGVTPINVGGEMVTLDAVVFGISDCNVCTWWSSYHAKEVEARGGIAAVVVHSTYAVTHSYAAVDNGFTQVRRIVLDRKWNSKAYSQAGISNDACRAYYRDVTLVNTPVDGDYAKDSMFTGERAWLNEVTPYDQLKWALAGEVTEADRNPEPITQETFNAALAWDTMEFTAGTYEKAAEAFNDYAMANNFGDGLPLVVPTAELVNEMLAGTTRGRDEVIGKMKMRGGIITVEKVAVNAVMAGAKPEYLPVLIAAMEAYANGWENDKMWYHNMSSGASVGMALILNGPLTDELGIADERGFAGSGQAANNTIGRAFRLCVRNIGHNYTPDVDTTSRFGRMSDHTALVFAEQEDELPDGWKPHHVMMGYEEDESTVTMIGIFSSPTIYDTSEDNSSTWTPRSLMETTRQNASSTANMVLLSPGIAGVMADPELAGDYCMPTKEAMKEWYATHNTDGGVTNRDAGIYNMTFPIVVGGDPNYVSSLNGFAGLYSTLCYQTQLVSGAALTESGRGATVPSAPQSFSATNVGDGSSITLSWDAPLSDGGSAITGYEVCWIEGGNRQYAPWTPVPGGADARSFTVTGLVEGGQNFFKIRATNSIHNASEFVPGAGWGSAPAFNDTRASGKGAWAILGEDVRAYKVYDFTVNFEGFSDVQIRYWTNGSWKTLGGNYNFYEDSAQFDIPEADIPANGKVTIQALYTAASPTGHTYTFSDVAYARGTVLDVPVATVTATVAEDGQLALVDGDWVYKYAPVSAGETVTYSVFDNGRRYEVRYRAASGSVASQYVFANGSVSF